MTAERFDELVGEALDELPEWIAARLENVGVLIDDQPPNGEPSVLGRYEGVPLTQRGFRYSGVLPDRITLYRANVLRGGGTEQDVKDRIRHVVVHEIAHFFGISDERLREIDRY
jgi:predicted Zn-dependent protease with MMP-like domain